MTCDQHTTMLAYLCPKINGIVARFTVKSTKELWICRLGGVLLDQFALAVHRQLDNKLRALFEAL